MLFLGKSKFISKLIVATGVTFVLLACKSSDNSFKSEQHTLTSPDGLVELNLSWASKTSPQLSVIFEGKSVVLPSDIDLVSSKSAIAEHDLELVSERSVVETVPLSWGQFKNLESRYNEGRFKLIDKATQDVISHLEVRVFNDAVALRHVLEGKAQSTTKTFKEVTEFTLAHDAKAWSNNGMKPTKQTESLLSSSNENLAIPVAFTSGQMPAIAFQEAGRVDTGMIKLKTVSDSAKVVVASNPMELRGTPSATSWRVLQIGKTVGSLLTSQVLVSLSPPNKIEDTSWIKTGKSFWDWRVRGEQYEDHTYALDNESLRRMIDFASDNNMQYVMIDANWYGPEHNVKSDPFTEIDGLNIKALINQANEKGIGFILYLNDKASVNYDLGELFETWSSWGAAGVKYGFMKLSGKEKVIKTLKIVELAAKHKLLINFHDSPIIPSGMRRTWPNWVTREAVHAQTDGLYTYKPSGFVEMAHINALAGPLDMSNGFFKLDGLKQSRDYVREEVYSTVASEVARSLIIFSGLIIFPDAPEEYLGKKDLFEFLENMPATWDESMVLSSDINEHIVTARRTGEEWFIGAAINEAGGTLPLKLNFLKPNQTYLAKIYADAPNTHYITNREAYEVITREVTQSDVLKMHLAPGGGQAIWLKPIKKGK